MVATCHYYNYRSRRWDLTPDKCGGNIHMPTCVPKHLQK